MSVSCAQTHTCSHCPCLQAKKNCEMSSALLLFLWTQDICWDSHLAPIVKALQVLLVFEWCRLPCYVARLHRCGAAPVFASWFYLLWFMIVTTSGLTSTISWDWGGGEWEWYLPHLERRENSSPLTGGTRESLWSPKSIHPVVILEIWEFESQISGLLSSIQCFKWKKKILTSSTGKFKIQEKFIMHSVIWCLDFALGFGFQAFFCSSLFLNWMSGFCHPEISPFICSGSSSSLRFQHDGKAQRIWDSGAWY